MLNRPSAVFYLAFVSVEISAAILTLFFPLILLTLGSSLSDVQMHGNELEVLRTAQIWSCLFIFLVGLINMINASIKQKRKFVFMLVFNCLVLAVYLVCMITVFAKLHGISTFIWNGIKEKKTVSLFEEYFDCCEPAVCQSAHNNTKMPCDEKLPNPFVSKANGTKVVNPFIAAFAIISAALILQQILLIIALVTSVTNLLKKTSEREPIRNDKTETNRKEGIGSKYRRLVWNLRTKLEGLFGQLGLIVVKNPKKCILLIPLFTGTCSLGFLQFNYTQYNFDSFVSPNSQLGINKRLVKENFPMNERIQRIIVSAKNVLEPEFIKQVLALDNRVKHISTKDGKTFEDFCLKVNGICTQRSILELWKFDNETIQNLTKEAILKAVNIKPLKSPVFNMRIKQDSILGTLHMKNSNIESAKDLLLMYVTVGTEDEWEDKFVEVALNSSNGNIKVYVNAHKSLMTQMNSTYIREYTLLGIGATLMFFYTCLSVGKMSLIKNRCWIGIACFLTIGQAVSTGIGIGIACGLMQSLLTPIISFLCIGIGIDDMFIITETWDKNEVKVGEIVPLTAKSTMKKAGVAILVTSMTDSLVFLCGSASHIQVYRGFSIMCSLCLFALFVYQCTFMLAILSLDHRRQAELYDGCLVCFKHKKTTKEYEVLKGGIVQWIFDNIMCKYILRSPVKIFVIIASVALSSVMLYYTTQLKVHFDLNYYISSSSYVHKYYLKYYSIERENGMPIHIYIVGENLVDEWDNIEKLYENLQHNKYVQKNSISSIVGDLMNVNTINKSNFVLLSFFLAQPAMAALKSEIKITDGKLQAFRFKLNHVVSKYTSDDTAAMNSIMETCKDIPWVNATSFPFTYEYVRIYSGETALNELKRNIVVVLICVIVIVFITVMSLQLTCWITIAVGMTMINLAGMISAMGKTIEVIASLGLLLSAGLAVDYSMHFGHYFLCQSGNRNERVKQALHAIGPAIFHAGISTILCVVVLERSTLYIFNMFGLLISMVVVFGLWNGLVFLPSVLSIIGPQEIVKEEKVTNAKESTVIKNTYWDTNVDDCNPEDD